jgi:trigger factor
MQIEVTELEPCKLAIHYEADAGEILDKRAEIIRNFKKAPVPGYRPGKATLDAIKMYYRSQIEESLKRALAEDAYHNTLFEKKLRPHGAPKFNSAVMTDGKFLCEFEMATKPDFELAPFRNLEIPKPHEPMDAVTMTEKMLQELRIKFGEVNPYVEGDFIQSGDNVIIDYQGFLDGVKLENLCAQGEMLSIGNSQLANFDDNLLGMSLGETREFDITVPANGLPSLAGKTVHFVVTLNIGSKSIPCPLDDTLATKMGKKDFAELREFVHGAATGKVASNFKMQLNEAIAHKLVDANTLSVPNWLSLSEAQYLVHSAKMDWQTLSDIDKEKYLEMAEKNVKLSLILDKIREVEPEAQLSDQEVFDIIKHNLVKSQVKTSLDDVIKEMNRTGYLQILMSRLRDEHTLDFVTKTVRVIE